MKLAIGIAHAAFAEGRRESLARLLRSIEWPDAGQHLATVTSTEREPAHVWARRLWQWAAEQDADATILLNDDVIAYPELVRAVRAMVEAIPGEILSLHAQGLGARALAEAGHRWCRWYCLTGPGYVLPRGEARKLLDWLDATPQSILDAHNEDGYVNLYAWGRRRPIWGSLPALVLHDTGVPSTLGYDEHPYRNTSVPFRDTLFDGLDLTSIEGWRPASPPPLIPNPWLPEAALRRLEDQRDHPVRPGERPRIWLALPSRGHPAPEFLASLVRLVAAAGRHIDLEIPWELHGFRQRDQDVVRTRSRFAREFLLHPKQPTHLLFLDEDHQFDPAVIDGMIRADKPIVLAPYPRRTTIDFRAADPTGKVPDARVYRYPLKVDGDALEISNDDGCAEILGAGLGCCLIQRAVLEQMVEHYRAELEVDEVEWPDPEVRRTVMLFQMPISGRALPSEDYAFFERWRALGGKVHCYFGPGAPIDHVGRHVYRGHIEAFGLERVSAAQ